jgi:hypothetical protein
MADPQDLHDAVWAKLQAVDTANAGLTAYDAIVPQNPPADDKGVTKGYAVLYASPGRLYASSLSGSQDSRDSTFQVTCGGGDPSYVFWAISKVQAGLIGPVTVNGRTYLIRAREDFDPGQVQRDETKTSARFFLPLEFRLHIP